MNKYLVVGLILLTACSKSDGEAKPAQSKPSPSPAAVRKARVRLQKVELKKVQYTVEASGALEASEEISIPARVAGVVDRAEFREGNTVTEKSVLVEIDLARHELAEKRAKADYDRAAAQKSLAEKLYQNRLNLSEEGKKRQKDWMSAEQLAMSLADLEKATADLDAARVEWDLAKKNSADATVRSPIPGVIQKKHVSKGEYVKAETIVATILNISPMYVRFSVPELEASRLKLNQEVLFSVQSLPKESFRAELFYMSQKADEATRAVECKAKVLEQNDKLRAGYFASVRMVTDEKDRLVVPERAIIPTGRGFIVFVVDKENKATSKLVTTGLRVAGGVEVLDGLDVSDTVVVDGATALKDGADVEPVTDEEKK